VEADEGDPKMTDNPPLALGEWRNRFQSVDACPWPGPRPLRADDHALLVGRHATRQNFRRAIRSEQRLLLLHGPSGVGKTSLLQAGLIPDLRRGGATVFSIDQWGGDQRDDVLLLLAEKLGLPESDGDPFIALNAALNDRAILVLDQFEELVRYSPVTAERVFGLILRLNRQLKIKIVISFRSEYLHDFAVLEDRAVNFSVSQFPLPELEDEHAENVILAGNKNSAGAIDDDAATALADVWKKARTSARQEAAQDDPFGRVGLLHLQAMLYALHFANDRRTLTLPAISKIVAEERGAVGLTGDGIDDHAFRFVLQRAIDFKLEHCDAVRRGKGENGHRIDESLSKRTRWMLARTVTHLSSAGYKLIRGAQELAHLALGIDHQALRDGLQMRQRMVTDEQEQALFETLLSSARVGETHDGQSEEGPEDLLRISRREIAATADARLSAPDGIDSWSSRLDDGSTPASVNDPLGVTCGSMMGLTSADVLIEELRSFVFAIAWLETSSLVRVTTPSGTGAMVSLIHDGFGPALIRWAERVSGGPAGPLNAITGPRGASFPWSPGPAVLGRPRPPAISGHDVEGGRLVLPNLRWRGGWVQADLERVAFVNCDFRGTMFDGCRMEGVSFVNCLLDGTIFSDCIFTGPQADIPQDEGWSESEPDFVVPAPASLVNEHARQRQLLGNVEAAFLCGLPGDPALPYRGEQASTPVRFADGSRETGWLRVDMVEGGTAVYGGRVSSLVMRKCYLDSGSGVAFRHTTGSGLEIVELVDSPGRYEIFGSAIRHVSFSSQVGARDETTINVKASASALAQIWVAPRLRGAFTVEGSLLIQAWNGSPWHPGGGVRFTAVNSTVHGLLDVDVDDSIVAGPPGVNTTDLGIPGIIEQLQRMDYRRNPARSRHDRRTSS